MVVVVVGGGRGGGERALFSFHQIFGNILYVQNILHGGIR